MLTNYLALIEEQRIKNPFYKKDYRLIRLPTQINSYLNVIIELEKYPNAFISNIISREKPLYKDCNDIYYYEFIDKGVGYNTFLNDWKYFYIPLSKFNSINNRLPSFKFYDLELFDVIKTFYLNKNIMYLNNNLTTEFLLSEKGPHPLLNHFLFTGKCALLKSGIIVYEYLDSKGYTDEESVSYFSFLEPINIFINSYNLNKDQIIEDRLLKKMIDFPPSKLNLYHDKNIKLQYSGRSTTNKFSNYKKWYEYLYYVNGFNIDTIILPYKPIDTDINKIDIFIYNKQIGIKLNESFNNQNLIINQFSSNKKINLL